MSAGEILLWIILPYVAIATFVVGHWWRYRFDQFGWTSGSTQLFEHKILGWAGPAFHYGALAAIGGHVIGLMIPKSFTEAIGMSESTYRWFSAIAGAVAGAVCVVGFFGLVYRRATNARVRRTTSRTDLLVYLLLVVLIVLGCWMTFAHNLITSSPYDYRESVSEWWRSLFILQPDVEPVAERERRLPGARDRRLGVLGAVPVQPPRPRLEHPAAVPRAAVHPLPAPLPRSAGDDPGGRRSSSRSPPSRSWRASTRGRCSGRSARTCRSRSACRTSRPRRWSPCPCCSARSCGSRSAGSPTVAAAGACSPRS